MNPLRSYLLCSLSPANKYPKLTEKCFIMLIVPPTSCHLLNHPLFAPDTSYFHYPDKENQEGWNRWEVWYPIWCQLAEAD
ncbi:hypothetical protein Taro_007562 [Colocasia esculenta]|uniref:Uncharacterized protein n=1 Tax=Colocasia esculenta TaxID=4460 RepID=A0A843U014_COLES|nr:hypothetical protein [Colocasia esculenta]